MHNYQRPSVILEDPSTSWMNRTGDSINKNSMGHSDGMTGHGTFNGTVMTPTMVPIPNGMLYRGTFNEQSSYAINDVVFVDPNAKYSASFDQDVDTTGSAPLCPGLFICISPINVGEATSDYLVSTIETVYTNAGYTISDDEANFYRWDTYNYYYPVCPIISGSAQVDVSDPGTGYNIVANRNFWQPLMPMIKSVICDDSETKKTIWVSAIVSGSQYMPNNWLPYQAPS